MGDSALRRDYIALTAEIVSAYVRKNSISAAELPPLIGQVHSALTRALSGVDERGREPAKPAISIKRSITPDYIVCLEDGKKFRSLKRHLRASYNMTPEIYRQKWHLPPDYPMVAPNHAAARSRLAKRMGLGGQYRRAKPVAGPEGSAGRAESVVSDPVRE